MRNAVFCLVVLVVLGGCTLPGPGVRQDALVDDRQLLVLTDGNPDPLIAQARLLGYVLMRIDNLGRLQETLIDLRIPADRSIPQAIDEIEALEPGVTAGANHAYTLQAQPPDLAYANAMIGWPTAGCAAHRRIGLIDAGVAQHHPALRSGTIIQAQMHLSDGVPRTRHGTLMADLLIGEGRLTGTTLYSANAVDPRQAAGDLAGVDAILRSVDWLAGSDVDLINISLAGPFNKLLNRGLGRASSDGIIFVAAAGNLGPTAPPQYPAAFPFVLAVTAVDRALSVYPRAVQGAHIDVAAPGVDILVRSGGRLRVTSGTSVAAPFVTAIIAADRDLRSARSREQVIARLAASAKDIGAVGKDSTFGIGMVQLPSSCAR